MTITAFTRLSVVNLIAFTLIALSGCRDNRVNLSTPFPTSLQQDSSEEAFVVITRTWPWPEGTVRREAWVASNAGYWLHTDWGTGILSPATITSTLVADANRSTFTVLLIVGKDRTADDVEYAVHSIFLAYRAAGYKVPLRIIAWLEPNGKVYRDSDRFPEPSSRPS